VRKDGIGYLRIAQMENGERFIASLNELMTKFADTRGLIIDVRGNGGGTQDAIKTILPWLMKPGSPMKIINIAAYRLPVPLPQPNRSGFLGLFGRGLHPVTSKVWTPPQASQIHSSATDNFLGALKGHPGVTLMGTASGGGSGRMASYVLPNSGLSMTLCQMASFATTGLTYDGNGVVPDIVMAPKRTTISPAKATQSSKRQWRS